MFDALNTTIQTILDTKADADKAVFLLRDKWEEAKTAFLQDCDRVDAAFSGEKESLRSEIEELSGTIKRLSGQLAAGITGSGRIDKDVKENLRKLIRDATARREEAEATLAGLDGVEPEYNRELYDAAIAAKEQFLSAYRGEYVNVMTSLYDSAVSLAREAEQAKETVRNKFYPYGLDDEVSDVESRFNRGQKQKKPEGRPVPASDPVKMLGEPMGRPAYLDEQPDVKPSKYRTETFIRDGKKVTQTVNNETGKVVKTETT